MCRGLQAGTVWVNTWNQFDTAVPFGGYKMSGIGREHGAEVLDHYTQVNSSTPVHSATSRMVNLHNCFHVLETSSDYVVRMTGSVLGALLTAMSGTCKMCSLPHQIKVCCHDMDAERLCIPSYACAKNASVQSTTTLHGVERRAASCCCIC